MRMLKFVFVLTSLFSSLFAGIIIVSIGLGAAFPSINFVAAPFVCPDGKMEASTQGQRVSAIQTVTTVTVSCVDGATGVKTDLNIFPMVLYAGTFYGLVMFLVWMIIAGFVARRIRSNPWLQRVSGPFLEQVQKVKTHTADAEAVGTPGFGQGAPVDHDKYVDKERYDELARRLQAELDKNKGK